MDRGCSQHHVSGLKRESSPDRRRRFGSVRRRRTTHAPSCARSASMTFNGVARATAASALESEGLRASALGRALAGSAVAPAVLTIRKISLVRARPPPMPYFPAESSCPLPESGPPEIPNDLLQTAPTCSAGTSLWNPALSRSHPPPSPPLRVRLEQNVRSGPLSGVALPLHLRVADSAARRDCLQRKSQLPRYRRAARWSCAPPLRTARRNHSNARAASCVESFFDVRWMRLKQVSISSTLLSSAPLGPRGLDGSQLAFGDRKRWRVPKPDHSEIQFARP